MNLLDSFVLGIIEGITEFLPISSTAHLIITGRFLNLFQTDFLKSFEIIIQLGAILAVIFLYGKKLIKNPDLIKKIITAFIPTAIIGLLLYKIIKNYFMNNFHIIILAMIIGGLGIIIFEYLHKDKTSKANLDSISYKQAVTIGLFQALAIIPGVSRSAATIIGGLSLGLSKTTIMEFSFLLAIPTMLAATGLDLLKSAPSFSNYEVLILLIGLITSFVTALLVIKLLLQYIQKHSFAIFGWYRIVFGLLLAWLWW